MSIAVSVLVRPSRRLCALQLGYALALALAGAGIAAGLLGSYAQAWWPACACALAAALAVSPVRHPMTRRLDVSGLGELRLTVQLNYAEGARARPARARAQEAAVVSILPGSTLWPAALLLRLADTRGARAVLIVLPDSVAQGQFRAVAVALAASTAMKIF